MSRGNGKCILKFENGDAYYQYATSSAYTEPFVGAYPKDGVTLEDAEVKYNLTEEEKNKMIPLTFEITSPGEIKWCCSDENQAYGKTIEYKKNDGDWAEITSAKDIDITTAITTTIGLYYYVGYDEETVRYVWSGNNGTIYTYNSNIDIYTGSEIYFVVRSVEQSGSAITTDYGTYYYIGQDEQYGNNVWSGVNGTVYSWADPENIPIGETVWAYVTELHQQHVSTPSISVASGDTVQFRGDNPTYNYTSYSGTTCGFKIKGNIMSLVSSTDFSDATTIASSQTFCDFFSCCTGLTDASKMALPATTLMYSCYVRMFNNCISLTAAPELPADTLVNSCYLGMFSDCTNLTAAPILPATTLVYSCYQGMFKGCTSLTTAPILPATNLEYYCCRAMFEGCTNLTTAPILPATNLAPNCYQGMFKGCTSLTTAPILPATNLASNCYQEMFEGCTSLTAAPELPATILVTSCYYKMFSGCTNLNYIKCLGIDSYNCANGWVFGVASAGTFENPNLTADTMYWTIGDNGIPTNWLITPILPKEYLTFEILENGEIGFNTSNTSFTDTIEFSRDGGLTWSSITSSSASTISVNSGDTIYFAGTSAASPTDAKYTYFSSTCRLNIRGNIMSLVTKENAAFEYNINKSYIFAGKFKGCKVVNAEKLKMPARKLSTGCYYQLFRDCTELEKSPTILPASAVTVSGYSRMFYGCTNLTAAPEMPASQIGMSGCKEMFKDCTSLVSGPMIISGSNANLNDSSFHSMFSNCTSLTGVVMDCNLLTLAGGYQESSHCYAMFSGCTNLKSVPECLSTVYIFRKNCFRLMFAGCTSLTEVPRIGTSGATNWSYPVLCSGSCAYMFQDCTGLTSVTDFQTSANLRDSGSSAYTGMFQGCTSLVTAPALPASELKDRCYAYMFSGCTNLTTAPELPATSATYGCYYGMFGGCTSLTTAPELPATLLYASCYTAMFYDCTSLTTAPQLPATNLAASCYTAMFAGCTSLTTPPQLPATRVHVYCYGNMFDGCTGLTSVPELPATDFTLGGCYYAMFKGCTSLTTLPENLLPSTAIAGHCYQNMFQDCTSLTTAPELPAHTMYVSCYNGMFKGCTSLTTAPVIPDVNLNNRNGSGCFNGMFSGCSSLNYIKALFTENPTNLNGPYTTDWVAGVAPTGTFVKNRAASWTSSVIGTNGVPTGWTVQNAT